LSGEITANCIQSEGQENRQIALVNLRNIRTVRARHDLTL